MEKLIDFQIRRRYKVILGNRVEIGYNHAGIRIGKQYRASTESPWFTGYQYPMPPGAFVFGSRKNSITFDWTANEKVKKSLS